MEEMVTKKTVHGENLSTAFEESVHILILYVYVYLCVYLHIYVYVNVYVYVGLIRS